MTDNNETREKGGTHDFEREMSAEEIEAVVDLLYLMGPSIDAQITLLERERNVVFGDSHITVGSWPTTPISSTIPND